MAAAHVAEPSQVVIGIETDRGLWVQALSAAGHQVYAVNPLAVARYRKRHQVSGAKSDAGDAKLLADLVRTDQHTNAPRSALREYYPAALEAFDDLHDRDALAVLGHPPPPNHPSRLTS